MSTLQSTRKCEGFSGRRFAISYVGIEVIDRSLLKARFQSDDMLEYLKQMPSESLASGGTAAYAGRGGGRKLASDLIANLEEGGYALFCPLRISRLRLRG